MICPFNEVAESVESFLGEAPAYSMYGAGALSTLGVPSGSAFLSTADESNAFSYIETPQSWWVYQAGPRLRCRELPRE